MTEKASGQEILHSLKEGARALLLPVIIVGGFRSGSSPTGSRRRGRDVRPGNRLVYREMKVKDLFEVLFAAAETTAIVMLLVAASAVSAFPTIAEPLLMVVEIMQPCAFADVADALDHALHHGGRHGG